MTTHEIDSAIRQIDGLRAELATLKPLRPSLLAVINERYGYEITYTSNAIKGNTLTLSETRQVIEHGVTVSGKPL